MPPRAVRERDIVVNDGASGAWVEKWRSPTTGAWVHNYTAEQVEQAAGAKFAALARFGARLPAIRARYGDDIAAGGRRGVIALVVALIDQACFRVGNPASAEVGVFGVTTLQRQHLSIRGHRCVFEYVGKKKQRQKKLVVSPVIARRLARLRRSARRANDPLFAFAGAPIRADEVNAYLSEFGVTARDFRTFHATRRAREILLAAGRVSRADREAVITSMYRQVAAEVLGNTAAVARDSYVDPRVVDRFRRGRLR